MLDRLSPSRDCPDAGWQSAGGAAAPRSEINYWPGFVDALSTLLLVIVFLLSVFMVGAVLPVAGR